MPHSYSDIRDKVLDNIVMTQVDKLQDLAEEKHLMDAYQCTFETLKAQYIEFLIASCAANAIGDRISPPLQVDELWHLHLLETESYDVLCSLIIEEVKNICPSLKLTRIHHSSIDNRTGRMGRLKAAATLYRKLGFVFVNNSEKGSDDKDENDEPQRKKRKPNGPQQKTTTLNATSQLEIYVRLAGDEVTVFKVSAGTAIDKIADAIESKYGLPVGRFSLKLKGKKITRGSKIRDYDIEEGSILDVSLSKGWFKINLKTLTGMRWAIFVGNSTTFSDLKLLIHDMYGIPPDQQHLIYQRCDQLKGSMKAYGIQEDSTIFLVLRSRSRK